MRGIRATEVRNFIRVHGEEGVIKCIEQLYERQNQVDQNVQELGIQLLHMTKLLGQITDGAGAMREQIERMQGSRDDEDLPSAVD